MMSCEVIFFIDTILLFIPRLLEVQVNSTVADQEKSQNKIVVVSSIRLYTGIRVISMYFSRKIRDESGPDHYKSLYHQMRKETFVF